MTETTRARQATPRPCGPGTETPAQAAVPFRRLREYVPHADARVTVRSNAMSGLGFALHAGDNDSFYYELAEGVPACATCGLVTEIDWLNPTFHLKRTRYDVSYTWDAALIVSDRFVRFASAYPGARFLILPSAPGFARFVVDPVVPFDAERRGTTFEYPCPGCGRFREIAGADPVYLKPGTVVPRGFSRTDVAFGSAHWDRPDRSIAQSPRLLVDSELGEALAAEDFIGLRLEPIPE